MIINEKLLQDALRGKLKVETKEDDIPEVMSAQEYFARKKKRYQEKETGYHVALIGRRGIWNAKHDLLNYI